MIDPRDTDVGRLFQELTHRENDAVRGRAVHDVGALRGPPHTKRVVHRQGMAGRRLLPVRRHDRDVAETRRCPRQDVDPTRQIAVVVRAEDPHRDRVSHRSGA